MLEAFHFLRPLWLLALIPLALLAWRASRPGDDNAWRRVVDARLLPLLMIGRPREPDPKVFWLLAVGWLVAVLALADPTWERKPQPVYQTTAATVVVLDLSRTMNATDLKPSRIARARYKIEDVLNLDTEGETALLVYAGDAFTVTPLTRDANTIRAQLRVLEPGLMPADGQRADIGLLKAQELLSQAGRSDGRILLVADGVDPARAARAENIAGQLRQAGMPVSVLDVGGGGADAAALRALATAGGGEYRTLADSNGDKAMRALLGPDRPARVAAAAAKSDSTAQDWEERGPWLAVLLLPLAALAFRRNWLLGAALAVAIAAPPRPAMASTWDDLWQRPDQQAAKALAAGDYAKAAELARDANRRGSAEYRRGDFPQAATDYARAAGADADYNRGNALAKMGRYADAIEAYDKSLEQRPGDADALANKAAVEALMKKQPPQQQQQSSSSKDGKDSKDPKDGQQQAGKGQGGQPQQGQDGQGKDPQAGADKPQDPTGKDAGQKDASAGQPPQKKPGDDFAEAAKRMAERNAGKDKDGDKDKPGQADKPGRQPPGDSPQANGAADPKQRGEPLPDRAQPMDSEEKLAADQWLRRIPDDPGGLLRRKFLYQYRQRSQQFAPDDDPSR